MKLNVVEFVESFLENKRNNSGRPESEFKTQLVACGITEELAQDLILYMDDEWTNEQFIISQLKYSRLNGVVGYVLGITGVVLTILSYGGFLGDGVGIIFFYGAIAGGFILGFQSQNKVSKLRQDLQTRKVNWKIRFRSCLETV